MSELIKTIIFVTLAVVIGVGALMSLPRTASQDIGDIANKNLFENIDTDKISRIRIVKFDGVAADSFEVNKTPTGWVIPTEFNYPASKQSQLDSALKFLPDLFVTNIASDREADKEKFGVIEPSEAVENIGQKKVGTLIELIGDGGDVLASAVVGSRVAGDENKSFVLVPGAPHIYVVELNPNTLSTNFRDWIDRDLLRIDPYRIERLSIRRVASATPVADLKTGEVNHGVIHDYRLEAVGRNGNWRVKEFVDYGEDGVEKNLDPADLNIDNGMLADIALNLADLKIADINQKPPGLKADVLKDKQYLGKIANQTSLRDHGFFLLPGGSAGYQIVAKGGELVITMKDGVEYVVRFGDFANATLDDEGKANRYAMISARVNEDILPVPVRGGNKASDDTDDTDEPPKPDGAEEETKSDPRGNEQAERIYLRKVQERNETLERAKREVERLNESYSPWYYIITQDAFEILTPPQSDLISK